MLSTSRTKYQFDFIVDVIDTAARDIGRSPVINVAFKGNVPQPHSDGADFSVNAYLQSLQKISPFLGDITIAGVNGKIYSSNLSVSNSAIEALFQKYSALFSYGNGKDFFVDKQNPLHSSGIYGDLITGVWPVFDIETQKLSGIIFLGLNYTVFQEMFILAPLSNNEKLLMIDDSNDIIFTYPEHESFEEVLIQYPEILTGGELTIEGKFSGKDSVIVSETSKILGWKFIRIIEAASAMSDTRKLQQYFNYIFVLFILLSIVFSLYISRKLTQPIDELVRACKRIEKGDTSFRVDVKSGDEMGQLGRSFNLLMDRINENFQKELTQQKRADELRLEVLQAQINPHFLYNTLDSIKFLATIQEVHNVASMASYLIILLKYNLSSRTKAALREEIESIINYAQIQKYRYGDIFELKTVIEPETEDCVITRFVLQPLVENAILHGFDDTEEGGEITVHSFLENDEASGNRRLCLELSDNGRGIEPEELKNRNSEAASSGDAANGSIGVKNIRKRMRLQFGKESSLTFQSESGKGTTARLVFPYN